MTDDKTSPLVHAFDFEGGQLRAYLFRGRPCWIAQEAGVALGYAPRSFSGALNDWAEELIEHKDFDKLAGPDLKEFLSLFGPLRDSLIAPARTSSLVVLYESGIDLVCIKSNKPLGRKLRRLMVDEVMPRLRRGEDIGPQRDEALGRLIAMQLRMEADREAQTVWSPDLLNEISRLCKVPKWEGRGRFPFEHYGRWMDQIYRIVLGKEVRAGMKDRNPIAGRRASEKGRLHYQYLTQPRHRIMIGDMATATALAEQGRSFPEFLHRLRFRFQKTPLQLSWGG